jgi:hypothetical protein
VHIIKKNFFFSEMAQLVTVRLDRHDSQPWGFRLQGGKDFGTPLLLQKVSMKSIYTLLKFSKMTYW